MRYIECTAGEARRNHRQTMTNLAAADSISLSLLGSTQGQWWRADYLGMPQTERRVSLESSWKGLHLWTASFRNERTGQFMGQRFFASEPKTRKIVAVFNNLKEREDWFKSS